MVNLCKEGSKCHFNSETAKMSWPYQYHSDLSYKTDFQGTFWQDWGMADQPIVCTVDVAYEDLCLGK